jgi:hypothetical protein
MNPNQYDLFTYLPDCKIVHATSDKDWEGTTILSLKIRHSEFENDLSINLTGGIIWIVTTEEDFKKIFEQGLEDNPNNLINKKLSVLFYNEKENHTIISMGKSSEIPTVHLNHFSWDEWHTLNFDCYMFWRVPPNLAAIQKSKNKI